MAVVTDLSADFCYSCNILRYKFGHFFFYTRCVKSIIVKGLNLVRSHFISWMSMITPRVNFDKRCDPKVVTERKMKWRQETSSIGQIATVMAKPRISEKKVVWLI